MVIEYIYMDEAIPWPWGSKSQVRKSGSNGEVSHRNWRTFLSLANFL